MTDWTEFHARADRHRAQMHDILEGVAKEFGAEVEDVDGDEPGVFFTVPNSGTPSRNVCLLITDAGEEAGPIMGNFVVRVEDGEENSSWGPDNFTDDCWAAYGDDEAWNRKIGVVAEQMPSLVSQIRLWKIEPSAAPTP